MLYKFSYSYGKKTYVHLAYTEREAIIFFQILLAIKCDYIKIITFTKKCK